MYVKCREGWWKIFAEEKEETLMCVALQSVIVLSENSLGEREKYDTWEPEYRWIGRGVENNIVKCGKK